MNVPDAVVRPPESARRDSTASRLETVRRLYVYLVALIAFIAGLFALDSLFASLADAWFDGPALAVISGPGFVRRAVAWSAGMLVVATPLFLLHWAAAQARAVEADERAAALRVFFLHAASAFALGLLLVRSTELLSGVARLAYGSSLRASDLFPSAWLHQLAGAFIAGLALWYWQSVARRDGVYGRETGVAAVWRRLFQAGTAVTGLAMITYGSAALLAALAQLLLDQLAPSLLFGWFPVRAGDGTARLLIGLLTAHAAWRSWRAVAARRPAALGPEDDSAVLWLFLYVAIVGGAVATLVPAALALRDALIWAFAGFADSTLRFLDRIVPPLAFIPAGILIWRRHARELETLEERAAADVDAEPVQVATVRRIYIYAVSATGLVLTWLGAINVVQVLLDLLLTADQVKSAGLWQRPLATGLSLLAVGLPVWTLHWRTAQQVARAPSAAGAEERASLPRRIYLYAVAFVGALLIVIELAQVVYRLFLTLLGDTTIAFWSPELAEELARSAIAALLWVVHLLALRGDGRLAGEGEARDAARSQRRAALSRRVARLEAELAQARIELADLDESR